MKLNKFLICTLLFLYLASTAQVTNVRKWRKTEKDSLENAMFFYDEKNYLRALPMLEQIYNNHPGEEFIRYIYARSALYRSDKHEDAYAILSALYEKIKR